MSEQLALRDGSQLVELADTALTIQSLVKMRGAITGAMKEAMKEKVHYGTIPGCGKKPTLLQPGAQLLCTLFRLRPEYETFGEELPGGHKKYRVTCRMFFIGSEPPIRISEGLGECSSMESKYRFRNAEATYKDTGEAVPGKYWDIKKKDGDERAKAWLATAFDGADVGPKKIEGEGWHVVIWTGSDGAKVENTNPPDVHNTVLKIAKKRAYVDATITATASSDFFTQDLEDIAANLKAYTGKTIQAEEVTDEEPTTDTGSAGEDQPPLDFGETRIHFGKNSGAMLSELTPQQVKWYAEEWLPKKEVNGPTSVADLALINALKAYHSSQGQASAPAPQGGAGSGPTGTTPPPAEKKPTAVAGLQWKMLIVHVGKARGPIKGKKLGDLPLDTRDYLRKEYEEKAKSDPDGKKLSAADKKLKAALAMELAERAPAADLPQAKGADDGDAPAAGRFNGPNHRALSESLDFAQIKPEDFIRAATAANWIPASVASFADLADEAAAKFADDFGSVQDAVRDFLATENQ